MNRPTCDARPLSEMVVATKHEEGMSLYVALVFSLGTGYWLVLHFAQLHGRDVLAILMRTI